MKDRLIPFGWALALFLLAGCQQEMETEIATRVTPEEKERDMERKKYSMRKYRLWMWRMETGLRLIRLRESRGAV